MQQTTLIDRAVIRLSPTEADEDVRGFLQGLVTQDTGAEMPLDRKNGISHRGRALRALLDQLREAQARS